jgi:tetratricopeptide (TPR) repeat protein
VATTHELVEQGIRAYVEGRLDESRRLLEEALRLDPISSRARSYLLLLPGGLQASQEIRPPAPPPAPPPTAPPAAPPASLAPPAPPPARSAPSAPPAPEPEPLRPEDQFAPSPWDDGPATSPSILLGSEGGLDLQAVAEKSDLRTLVPRAARPATPQDDVAVWMTAAKDLLALGDFSGSLEMIEKILKVDPEHAEARDYLSQNEATLVAMYESKLGPLGGVPRLAIKPEEIMWLNLDHRAGFLLAQIDGEVDYESLFALSGLPRLDTARILASLLGDGVIAA